MPASLSSRLFGDTENSPGFLEVWEDLFRFVGQALQALVFRKHRGVSHACSKIERSRANQSGRVSIATVVRPADSKSAARSARRSGSSHVLNTAPRARA